MFITVEGPDGVGKSEQAKKLAAWLEGEGHAVTLTREPGGTVAGAKIRHMLLTPDLALDPMAELLLFLADRAQHVAEVIRPALDAGHIVVCDRYGDSTWAYQGYARGYIPMLQGLRGFIYPIMPDLTLVLDADPETCASRMTSRASKVDRLDGEALAFRQAVRRAFCALAKEHRDRCRLVPATGTAAYVHEAIARLVTVEMHKKNRSQAPTTVPGSYSKQDVTSVTTKPSTQAWKNQCL